MKTQTTRFTEFEIDEVEEDLPLGAMIRGIEYPHGGIWLVAFETLDNRVWVYFTDESKSAPLMKIRHGFATFDEALFYIQFLMCNEFVN